MRRSTIPSLLLVAGLLAGCASVPPGQTAISISSPQRSQLFDDGWLFVNSDAPGAMAAAYDTSAWQAVRLPHDWSIDGAYSQKNASATAYLPAGIGWYRKSFTVPDSYRTRHIAVRFDGVYKNSQVWCNGQPLGRRPSGYDSFEYDITSLVHFGGAVNILAVRVDHSDNADSRWYPGSGIYRNVFLLVTDPVHIAPWGTFVTTPQISSDSADLSVTAVIQNDGSGPADITVLNLINNPAGQTVATTQSTAVAGVGEPQTVSQTARIANPALWSVDSPSMYDVETKILRQGQVLDDYHTPVGIRTAEFDANKGFLLNRQSIKLKGVCLHEDAGALGSAIPIKVWIRRLATLRKAGCNAIRCSHNPPAPEFLDLCDRMGFLVMDEAFDEWTRGKRKWIVAWNKGTAGTDGYHIYFDQWSDTDLHDMIVRDRNHPSIIMWSIGNEIDYPRDAYPLNSPELPPIAARLISDVKALDTTRPVTAACAAIASNLFYPQLDVVGYNYQEPRYAADHAAHPDRVIYGSENKLSLSAWEAVEKNDFISGQFLWTGIDYMGESRKWPDRGSADGIIDFAGFEKPEFFFRKSLWTAQPMVYLLPASQTATADAIAATGNAPTATSPKFTGVTCYTNCQSVEFFQNGKSLGESPLPPSRIIHFPASLADGSIGALGKRDGAVVCEYILKRPGPAAKLVIHSDALSLAAGGQDVANVEVDVVDADGNRIPDATDTITVSLAGPAHVLAIENGDIASHADNRAPAHPLFNGRAMIYIQSVSSAGRATVTVSAPNLQSATLNLQMR